MSIVEEHPGFLQVLSDGSVKRFSPEILPPLPEFSDGHKSKDVTIDPSVPITARIFLPETPGSSTLLPVIFYFHGGGFCICSTTWAGYHHFLAGLCVTSQSLVISVDYRLAPENRLPAAYNDCFLSLEWLSRHARQEPWLERADLSRVFLCGESAGGNITHHVAVRASVSEIPNVQIKGLLVIHPYFGSEKRLEVEKGESVAGFLNLNDMYWRLSLPAGSGRDHFACNFEVPENGLPEVVWGQFPAVAIYVAGLDLLKERGLLYGEFLKKKGVKRVEVVVTEGEPHAYHVYNPRSDATRVLQAQISEFVRQF